MAPAPNPLYLYAGDYFTTRLYVTDVLDSDIDYSDGYTALMQIRADYADTGAPVQIELTDTDGLVLGSNYIDVTLTSSQTGDLVFTRTLPEKPQFTIGLYDLEVVANETGATSTFTAGDVWLERQVSVD